MLPSRGRSGRRPAAGYRQGFRRRQANSRNRPALPRRSSRNIARLSGRRGRCPCETRQQFQASPPGQDRLGEIARQHLDGERNDDRDDEQRDNAQGQTFQHRGNDRVQGVITRFKVIHEQIRPPPGEDRSARRTTNARRFSGHPPGQLARCPHGPASSCRLHVVIEHEDDVAAVVMDQLLDSAYMVATLFVVGFAPSRHEKLIEARIVPLRLVPCRPLA